MATDEVRTPAWCRFGTFEFDLQRGELLREGRLVKLQPQPARLLALLVAHAGRVVLRDEIKTHLWGHDTFVDFERGLNFCILQVRTALGDQSDNPRFIQTVPRRGYRFIAPVWPQMSDGPQMARMPDEPQTPRVPDEPRLAQIDTLSASSALSEHETSALSPSSVARETSAPSAPSAARETSTPSAPRESSVRSAPSAAWRLSAAQWWLAALLIGGVALVIAGLIRRDPPASAAKIRLAVLPIENLTGDPDADYLADGLTDELIAQLGRLSPDRLGVISRTSVMAYRGAGKSVAEIGRELDVAFVVEGALRRDGSRVRVTSELVSTGDQTQIWADAFERPDTDTVLLQTDVGARIAGALARELVPGTPGPGLPPPTRNADAWDLYLRGRHFMNRGTPSDVAEAVRLFEAAVAQDPAFAAGWAQIAEARHLQVMIGSGSPLDAYPAAGDAARRALGLDGSLADAHVAAGLVQLWFDWSPSAAADSFARALALNGSHGAAHHDYAWALVGLGRFDEAVAHITAARDLDPLSARANTDIGWMRLHLRQPTEAVRACEHTLAIQPASLEAQACLERAYLQRGLLAEAVNAARTARPVDADAIGVARGVEPLDQLRAIWQRRLDGLEQALARGWTSPYSMATLLVALDRPEAALTRLLEAYDQRIGMMAFLGTDPAMDPLRADARFQAILAKVKASARQPPDAR